MIILDGTIRFSSKREEYVVLSQSIKLGVNVAPLALHYMDSIMNVYVAQGIERCAKSGNVSFLSVYEWLKKSGMYRSVWIAMKMVRLWWLANHADEVDALHWANYCGLAFQLTGRKITTEKRDSKEPMHEFSRQLMIDQWKLIALIVSAIALIVLLFPGHESQKSIKSHITKENDMDSTFVNHMKEVDLLLERIDQQSRAIEALEKRIASLSKIVHDQDTQINNLSLKRHTIELDKHKVRENAKTDEGLKKEGKRILGDLGITKIQTKD